MTGGGMEMKMSASLQKSTKRTNIDHNNRTEEKLPPHIDQTRLHENKYLVQENIKDVYAREFDEPLKKYNDKQKRKDRKIDNYYKHIQSSKKTATQQEMILQIGDKDDFDNPHNWELTNEVLEEWFNDFEKRNPNLKVYNAVIHNDEASPHLHINFVPVASGYKRGLEKQVAFDRAIKQQDPSLDNTRPFDDWREKEVAVLERLMNERGVERKLVGKNEYKDVNEYKQKKDELRELETRVENEMEKLDVLVDEPKRQKNDVEPIIALGEGNKPMPKIELKKNPLFGSYSVEPEQIESLKDYTNRLKYENSDLRDELDESKENYKRLRKSYLNDRRMINRLVEDGIVLERQKMARERFNYDKTVGNLSSELKTLENENKELRKENMVLQQWKDKAIGFMEKLNVYDKFKNMFRRRNRSATNEMER